MQIEMDQMNLNRKKNLGYHEQLENIVDEYNEVEVEVPVPFPFFYD